MTPPIDKSLYQSAIESHDSDDARSFSGVSMSSGEAAILDREEVYNDNDFEASGPQWVWLAFGSCKLDLAALPAGWFADTVTSYTNLSGEPWRVNILQVKSVYLALDLNQLLYYLEFERQQCSE